MAGRRPAETPQGVAESQIKIERNQSIMTNYEIRENPQFNSREVYFDGNSRRAESSQDEMESY